MPPRSQAKHAALAAAAKGSADIRDALHGNVTAMPPVITIDADLEAAPSSRKKARLTSHPLPSEGHLDIRAALEHGHALTRTALSPMSFTAAQEEALLHWGADSFAATCDAWARMGADASPLVLLANFQLIPPRVVELFGLPDNGDGNHVNTTRGFLGVASAWWRLQRSELPAEGDGKAKEDFVDAAVAFGDTRRILKIRPEWLDKILAGQKTLEIRGSKCPHTGWVSIASTGQGMIRCRAKLGPSHPLTEEEHRQHAVAVRSMGYKNPWAWPIEALEMVEPPIRIPPHVARAAVQWITRERWEKLHAEATLTVEGPTAATDANANV